MLDIRIIITEIMKMNQWDTVQEIKLVWKSFGVVPKNEIVYVLSIPCKLNIEIMIDNVKWRFIESKKGFNPTRKWGPSKQNQ